MLTTWRKLNLVSRRFSSKPPPWLHMTSSRALDRNAPHEIMDLSNGIRLMTVNDNSLQSC